MMMTQAPVFDHTTGLIDLHFDGLFYDKANRKFNALANTEWQPRQEQASQLEQFFIHESMANSMLYAMKSQNWVYTIDERSLSDELKKTLHSYEHFCG